jgi:hypothetical protein
MNLVSREAIGAGNLGDATMGRTTLSLVAAAVLTFLMANPADAKGHGGHGHHGGHHGHHGHGHAYFSSYGHRYAGGYYYVGRDHYHWSQTIWYAPGNCYLYLDPGLNMYYSWDAAAQRYYPSPYQPRP